MRDAAVSREWSANARNRAVTEKLLARAAEVLEGMQKWQETIAIACRFYNFQTFTDAADWFETVPRVDPGTRAKREKWLREQRKIAHRKPAIGPIDTDRQLEIALAALDAQAKQESPLQTSIRNYHSRGVNDAEMARQLNVAANTIARNRKALGLPANGDGGQHHRTTKERAA